MVGVVIVCQNALLMLLSSLSVCYFLGYRDGLYSQHRGQLLPAKGNQYYQPPAQVLYPKGLLMASQLLPLQAWTLLSLMVWPTMALSPL